MLFVGMRGEKKVKDTVTHDFEITPKNTEACLRRQQNITSNLIPELKIKYLSRRDCLKNDILKDCLMLNPNY